jgi:hypothetical protein
MELMIKRGCCWRAPLINSNISLVGDNFLRPQKQSFCISLVFRKRIGIDCGDADCAMRDLTRLWLISRIMHAELASQL